MWINEISAKFGLSKNSDFLAVTIENPRLKTWPQIDSFFIF